MRKLALDDRILRTIQQPARYIGGELNSVMKNKEEVDVRFCMCFPDVYEIGMSHLGIAILYDMFNKMNDVWCERVYSPWPDMHEILKEKDIPLFALESQDPIKSFDFLGITLQYEMCYTNILQILDLSKISLYAKDRDEDDPIVIGGGPCSYNPEPIADFFDCFYIGEGEVQYRNLIDAYKEHKKSGGTRSDFLKKISNIPGIYVPSLYDVEYNEDGTLKSFTAKDGAPAKVVRQVVGDLTNSTYPTKPIVPFIRATQDRMVLEIQRGCIRGCRFCQAGMIYRPNREKKADILKEHARELIKNTGYEEISLSSLSSSDYKELPELLDFLIEECGQKKVNISLPSLRIDAFSLDVMNKVQDVRKSSLTFAPEAGSQRLRNVINKGLTVENIMNGATMAFKGGWNKVKLYFMLGLPTETEDDMRAIPELANDIAMAYYDTVPKEERKGMGKCQVTISTSFFVPKPFTPFQWCKMEYPEEYLRRAGIVKDTMMAQLNKKSLRYMYHEAYVTVLEGLFARGNRNVSKAIVYAYEHGAIFDAWNEFFKQEIWDEAFEKTGIDLDFYTQRVIPLDELLPWDFIDVGVTKNFLLKQWETAQKEEVTPNCRMACSGCGAARFKEGVCLEH